MSNRHVTGALALAFAAGAAAADDRIDLVRAGDADLFDGYSARHLLDLDVRGEEGRPLGEIENLIVTADGRIDGVVIESQGFLGIGDKHFKVPWQQLRVATNGEYASVPVAERSLPNFSFFDGEEVPVGARAWRVDQLLGDVVEISPAAQYGVVDDLVIDRDGSVRALVLAEPRSVNRYDRYGGNPYSGEYDPAQNFHTIPRGRDEVANLGPFDVSRVVDEAALAGR